MKDNQEQITQLEEKVELLKIRLDISFFRVELALVSLSRKSDILFLSLFL